MKINEKRQVTFDTEVTTAIQCDVCKKTFDVDKDILEKQEFHEICFIGGYGSIFGDGAKIRCDICQKCLKEKLGEYLRYED